MMNRRSRHLRHSRERGNPASIRTIYRGTIVLTLTLLVAFGVNAEERPHRFIYNSDGGHMFIDKGPGMTPEDVYTYVDEVADKGITSFFMCPNYCMPMLYPSEVCGMIGYNATEEQEKEILEVAPVKTVSMERAIVNLRGLVEKGHDPVGIVLDRAKEKGMEAFVSFRLNEIHNVQEEGSLLLSNFWRDHPEWRVAEEGHEVGPVYAEIIGPRVHPIVSSWFWGGLNFAVPQVRERRLAQLREICERYPQMDGLDIDFQRFPVYFKEGEEKDHVGTMTEWMREVRKMTDEVGKKRGRPILLCARVMARPAQNLGIGLDPISWSNEGIVDFLVASHYLRNDYAIPVQEYRKDLPEDFPLYASIEVEPIGKTDLYFRIAKQLWRDGADGLLMFNFFTSREGKKEPPFELLPKLNDREGLEAMDIEPFVEHPAIVKDQ